MTNDFYNTKIFIKLCHSFFFFFNEYTPITPMIFQCLFVNLNTLFCKNAGTANEEHGKYMKDTFQMPPFIKSKLSSIKIPMFCRFYQLYLKKVSL